MLLFSKKGVELLEKYGGHRAADFYRRNYDLEDSRDLSRIYESQMVKHALLAMQPERFVQVIARLGDAEAALSAFRIFADADISDAKKIRETHTAQKVMGFRDVRFHRGSFTQARSLLRDLARDAVRDIREFRERRRLRRYNDAYREMLIGVIIQAGDKVLIKRARDIRALFTEDERTQLFNGLRIVRAA